MGTRAERERGMMGRVRVRVRVRVAFLNNYLKYPQKLIANDWGRSSSLNVNIEEMID